MDNNIQNDTQMRENSPSSEPIGQEKNFTKEFSPRPKPTNNVIIIVVMLVILAAVVALALFVFWIGNFSPQPQIPAQEYIPPTAPSFEQDINAIESELPTEDDFSAIDAELNSVEIQLDQELQ